LNRLTELKKIYLLVLLNLTLNASAQSITSDWGVKVCNANAKQASLYYSRQYDLLIELINLTSSESPARKEGIKLLNERMEKIVDSFASDVETLTNLDAREKNMVVGLFENLISKMKWYAYEDVKDGKSKQPTERIQRKLFSDCIALR
jgi:hypothetical protein